MYFFFFNSFYLFIYLLTFKKIHRNTIALPIFSSFRIDNKHQQNHPHPPTPPTKQKNTQKQKTKQKTPTQQQTNKKNNNPNIINIREGPVNWPTCGQTFRV